MAHVLPTNPKMTANATAGTVTLSCASLAAGKSGIIKPDENGAYEIVLGGFNVNNRSGDFYPADERVKALFKPGSPLMRRMANKALKGEYKHPTPSANMAKKDWITRICTIEETLVSHNIVELTIDFNRFTNDKGEPIMTIIGKIVPCGPYGDVLRKSLESPHENTAFSIRSLSINKPIMGILNRFVTDIVTWDHVNEGGLTIANKHSSPSVECLVETQVTERTVNTIATDANGDEVSFESVSSVPLMTLRSALGEIQVTDLNRSSFYF